MSKQNQGVKAPKFVTIELLDFQVDILLRALEVYSLEFHNFRYIEKDIENQDIINSSIYYLYKNLLIFRNEYQAYVDVTSNCERVKKV